ncbi:NAD(P)-binding protein [Bimuria novae-zelandiae CBS 107.79]|uniref:Short-chain dehydrogenase/reductase 3 n=1 Tax=Bimuria novae-zelandiae CBS 107.79 TaxID=1447943 RepID=A0A6A5VSM7_9PLEO|nr:NAD(P)-binding protein [Bimuria novae-zelandiae CBS 107.79]
MPIRSEWKLAREGWTLDTTVRLLQSTAFNPLVTLPLFLAANYTEQGAQLVAQHGTAGRAVEALLALGVLNSVSGWLDDKVMNNFKGDEWDWKKEVVVVTGGADGIGKRIVLLLAEKGIKVAVLDVQQLTYEAPPSVHYFHCDLASKPSILSASSALRTALGAPTVLINNAGCARGKTILNATEADLRLTFNVNTLAHYFLAQQFLPSMIAANHGMLVTVASLAGYITAPSMVDYCASKAAAIAFHEGLAVELVTRYRAPKVRTVLMTQGYTRTALFEGFGTASLYPETVAEEIVKAVLKGRSAQLCLPETAWGIVPKVRGWPVWAQYAFRKGLKDVMKTWNGRQVVQPSENVGEKKGIEESGVLVKE